MLESRIREEEELPLSEYDLHYRRSGKRSVMGLVGGIAMAVLAGILSLFVRGKTPEVVTSPTETIKQTTNLVVEGTKDVGEVAKNTVDKTVEGTKDVVNNIGDTAKSWTGKLSGSGIGNIQQSLASGNFPLNKAVTLELEEPIRFDYGSSSLTNKSQQTISKIAEELQQLNTDKVAVQVVGHSSKVGNYNYNMALSQQRAEAVAKYLRSFGINNKISSEGKGYNEPMIGIPASNDTQQRTEVKLIKVK